MMKIYDLNQVPEEEIFARQEEAADVSAPVADILRDVKERGDAALLDYAKKFDKAELSALEVTPQELEEGAAQVEAELSALEVTPQELEEGAAQVDGEFTAILREAAGNIRSFHAKQKREGFLMAEREGVILGQKITPLARVGIYVPGGTAAYPSTVLMNAIPAHIAGVGDPPAGTGRSARPSWRRPSWRGSPASSRWGAPRRWPPWPTGRKRCPRWTRSWVPATPMWPRPSGRCSAW